MPSREVKTMGNQRGGLLLKSPGRRLRAVKQKTKIKPCLLSSPRQTEHMCFTARLTTRTMSETEAVTHRAQIGRRDLYIRQFDLSRNAVLFPMTGMADRRRNGAGIYSRAIS